eukprot:SAG31_NODE_399_length_16247_cov_19.137540_14_plen_137_part_00
MSDDDDDQEYDALIDSFGMEEALECCKECGIVIDGEFPLDTLKAALRNQYVASVRRMSVDEVFDLLDTDNSGGLNLHEVQIGVALLNGSLLSGENLAAQMKELDRDDNGTLCKDEFHLWYLTTHMIIASPCCCCCC